MSSLEDYCYHFQVVPRVKRNNSTGNVTFTGNTVSLCLLYYVFF